MPSRYRWPRLTLALALLASLLVVGGVAYSLWANPEVDLYYRLLQRKQAWARRLEERKTPKLVAAGGSSCAFSLDGERLGQQWGLPAVNMGLHAAFGYVFNTQAALAVCRPGDTLLLSLEPFGLTNGTPADRSNSAVALAYRCGHPGWLRDLAASSGGATWQVNDWPKLRTDGSMMFAQLGKFLLRKPAYRYLESDASPSGYMRTALRIAPDPAWTGQEINAPSRAFLAALRTRCAAMNVRLLYTLPWGYTWERDRRAQQLTNLGLLATVAEYMPILPDPALGVVTDPACFADTNYHLTAEAARRRTDAVGAALQAGHFWNVDEVHQQRAMLERAAEQ